MRERKEKKGKRLERRKEEREEKEEVKEELFSGQIGGNGGDGGLEPAISTKKGDKPLFQQTILSACLVEQSISFSIFSSRCERSAAISSDEKNAFPFLLRF